MSADVNKLEKELEQALSVEDRIDALNALAWEVGYVDIARAIQLAEEARRLATSGEYQSQPYQPGLSRSLLTLSRMHTELGSYADSMKLLLQARPLFESLKDSQGMMQVLNEFGRIYYYLSDFATALQYYMEEMSLAKDLQDAEREATTTYNIGLIHLYSETYKMAVEDLNRALRLIEELGDMRLKAFALEGLAEAFAKTGEHEKALEYSLQSLAISTEMGLYGLQNNTLLTMGDTYMTFGDLEKAEECYQKALQASETTGSRHDSAYAIAAIGKFYRKRGEYKLALEWLTRAREMGEEIGSPDLVFDCHLALSDTYKGMEDYQKALEHYEQYHAAEKAMFNEKSDLKLKTLEVIQQVETARREAEIYQLKNALLQQEIEEHKKVQAMLEELVKTEPLTGLFNRRHFYDLAEKEFRRARRYNHPFSVIMADIDHFKQINDNFGHAAGDQALVTVANLIRRNLRSGDLVCRYGGEEFAFLLPETGGQQAFQVAERIRAEIADYAFTADGVPYQLSISIGVAECPADCASLDRLLNIADHAMYQAKALGRNQAYLYAG